MSYLEQIGLLLPSLGPQKPHVIVPPARSHACVSYLISFSSVRAGLVPLISFNQHIQAVTSETTAAL